MDALTDAERAALAANLTMDLDADPAAGTDLVPATQDGQWISRASRLAILEREADAARATLVRAHYEYGDILREYKELCVDNGAQWEDFCARQEISRSFANSLIQVATTVRALPSLKDLANKSITKVLTLIQGTDSETLAQIADGAGPIPVDDIDAMPVSKLKRELRRHRADISRIVAEETRTLKSETEALREDLAAARAALDPDLAAARKTAKQVRAAVQDLADACDRLLDQLGPLPSGDLERLRDTLESNVKTGTMRLNDLWQTAQERFLELGLD
jgi:ElaB/YqjD/DUF883 family membrane-anchored ribosome-binding protein